MLLHAKVLKETETIKTISFFVAFLLLAAFPLGVEPSGPLPPGYAYAITKDYPVYANPGKAKILENSPTSAAGTESTTKFWASGFIVTVPVK